VLCYKYLLSNKIDRTQVYYRSTTWGISTTEIAAEPRENQRNELRSTQREISTAKIAAGNPRENQRNGSRSPRRETRATGTAAANPRDNQRNAYIPRNAKSAQRKSPQKIHAKIASRISFCAT
jgi:hypothetical protein